MACLVHALAVVAADGSMAMLVFDVDDNVRQDAVDLYSANGDPIRTIQLPRPSKNYTGIAYDGERIVIAGNREILTLDRTGDNMRRWSLTEPAVTESRWGTYIMPGGDELLLYDEHERKLYRYELPRKNPHQRKPRPRPLPTPRNPWSIRSG